MRYEFDFNLLSTLVPSNEKSLCEDSLRAGRQDFMELGWKVKESSDTVILSNNSEVLSLIFDEIRLSTVGGSLKFSAHLLYLIFSSVPKGSIADG